MGRSIKKVVAVCFMEAVKLTAEHMNQHLITSGGDQHGAARGVVRQYAEVRRLIDYLRRVVNTYLEEVEIDLNEREVDLLVACCVRNVWQIDFMLENGHQSPQETEWLHRKRKVLADWAFELSSGPLVDLGLPAITPIAPAGVQALRTRLMHKHGVPAATEPEPEAAVRPAVAAAAEQAAMTIVAGTLFDVMQIRDPRLRKLAATELQSFHAAKAQRDVRMAAIHLASLFECVILDFALPQADNLALSRDPNSWDMLDVVVRLIGPAFTNKNRVALRHLMAARNQLFPVTQLQATTVVTAATLGVFCALVQGTFQRLNIKANISEEIAPLQSADQRS